MAIKENLTNRGLLIASIVLIFIALCGLCLSIYIEVYLDGEKKVKFFALVIGVGSFILAIFFETLRINFEVAKIEQEIKFNNLIFTNQIEEIKKDNKDIKDDIFIHNKSFDAQISDWKNDIKKNHEHFNDEIIIIKNMIATNYGEIRKEFRVYPNLTKLIPTHYEYLSDLYNISKIYSTSPLYQSLFEKYLPYWFNNLIDKDLAEYKTNLEKFTLLYDGYKLEHIYNFFNIAWEAVNDGGSINATSIVMHEFWENSHDYLNFQKNLSNKKSAKISRYFLFPESRFNEISLFQRAFELNKDHNISVRVMLLNRVEDIKKYYQDYGLIDNSIAIISEVDEKNIITRSSTYIDHATTRAIISKISGIFRDLEKHHNTIKLEDYGCDITAFINGIGKRIKEMSGN